MQKNTEPVDCTSIINWFSVQLSQKKIKIQSLKELKSGCFFMETLSIYFPKQTDLTKVYLKPKNSFQVIQNYRQILSTFSQLGWKKIDPQKYVKQQDKDCIDMANFIMKKITAIKKSAQKQTGHTSLSIYNNFFDQKDAIGLKVQQLTRRKQKAIDKLLGIEHIMNEATDCKVAKNLILKLIQQ